MALANVEKKEVKVGAEPAKGGKKKVTYNDKMKAQGEKLRATMDEKTKELEGSKSGAVEYVIGLAHPGKKSNKGYLTVGYKLKALEDIQVPVAPVDETSSNEMDFKSLDWKLVKAGEIFTVNMPELGILISQVEYAGRFTGGENPVELQLKYSRVRGEGLTVLQSSDGKAIKDEQDYVAEKKDGKWTVRSEYADKFGYLFKSKSANRSTSKKKKSEHKKNLAAAFRAVVEEKAKNLEKK